MKQNIITEVSSGLPRYNPGHQANITVNLTNSTEISLYHLTITLNFMHLEKLIDVQVGTIHLENQSSTSLTFVWQPPDTDFKGYLVEVSVKDSSGALLDHMNTAVDVSSTWTKFPRYGYLAAFDEQPSETSAKRVKQLAKYHINALQFYDWHWKHHVPLCGTPSDPCPAWEDVAKRTIAKQTIEDLIQAAHDHNMSAMPYNLLYGAFDGYEDDGASRTWGMFEDQTHTKQWGYDIPSDWATSRIWFMNPGNVDWQNYIIDKQKDVFAAFNFDGWHVDQVGEWPHIPKYDYDGNTIDQSKGFAALLDNAKSKLEGKTVVFNNVNTYGYEDTANTDVDIMYTELWDTRDFFNVKAFLDCQTEISGGRASVFPLYMNYEYQAQFSYRNPGFFNTPGVLLANAGLFAMGASHLELGDDLNMLNHEYFVNKNLIMSEELKRKLLIQYDFLVAYQNLLRDGLANSTNRVELEGISSSPKAEPDKVWTFTKAGKGYEVIQMVNQLGIADTDIKDKAGNKPKPAIQHNIPVKYYYSGGPVNTVNFASPDHLGGSTRQLPFTSGSDEYGNYVSFTVPVLEYWNMIYFRSNV